MGIRELRELYGAEKGSTVLNRAVKAEIPGAESLYRLLVDLHAKRRESPELEATYERLLKIKNEMVRAVAAKHGLKSASEGTA
jgi:hypothetical protein